MKKFTLAFGFAMLLAQSVVAATDIEFILDISGSMNKAAGGTTQIADLRTAVANTLGTIPQDTFVAVRLYGHRVEQTNKTESCKDTELSIPFAPLQKDAIIQKINAVTPKGYTPIAYSLEQSRQDFLATRESNKTIILMTDGEETCDGDPIAVINKMKADGFNVTIHTIGFNVDANTKQQLQNIANTGGGQYFDANGATGLQTALTQATQASLLIQKKNEITGEEIRGGDGFESAVVIKLDTVYRLDHHQKVNQYDYFALDLKTSQQITVNLSTGEKGIQIRPDGKMVETTNPYAGFSLVDANRKEIKKREIIGQQNSKESIVYDMPADGRVYLLVGSGYDAMNKDFVTFTATAKSNGDLGTDKDAGTNMETAMPMTVGRHEQNHLSPSDMVDVFSFAGKKGQILKMGFIPYDTDESWMTFNITDSYRQSVINVRTTKGQGVRSDAFTLPEDDTYYLEVKQDYGLEKAFRYMIELKPVETVTNPTTEGQ